MDATVITNDGALFHIDDNFVDKCKTLANAFEDAGKIYALPLPNLDSQIMKRVLKYYETGDLGDRDNMPPCSPRVTILHTRIFSITDARWSPTICVANLQAKLKSFLE